MPWSLKGSFLCVTHDNWFSVSLSSQGNWVSLTLQLEFSVYCINVSTNNLTTFLMVSYELRCVCVCVCVCVTRLSYKSKP